MKRVTVVAHAQYDFNDLRKQWVNETHLAELTALGVNLELTPNEVGINRVKHVEPIDVLIVDYHSFKSSEDIVTLCRELHPEAKIVMFDAFRVHQPTNEEREKYDALWPMDCGARPAPVYVVRAILNRLGLRDDPRWDWCKE